MFTPSEENNPTQELSLAALAQSQPATPPDGAVAEIIPAAAGAEAATTQPQSIATQSTLAQVSQGAPTSPSLMDVFELDEYLRRRARYHALEIAKDMPYVAEMRKLLYAPGQRSDLKKRYVSKDGRIWALGWQDWAKSYAAEVGKSLSTIKRELAKWMEPEPPKLTDGSIVVLEGSEGPLYVFGVHQTAKKVEVIPLDATTDEDSETVDTKKLKKVTVHNAEVGTFYIRDKQTGKKYVYSGHGKLSVIACPPVLEAKWEEERKERERLLKEDRERKEEHNKRRQAENTKRALDEIAKAKDSKNAKRRGKKGGAKPVKAVSLVKVAKLEIEDGFALFEEAAFAPFTLNKATSGKFDKLGAMRGGA